MDNKYNIGLEVFFINLILIAYLFTSDGEVIYNSIVASISSLAAVIINGICYTKDKKNKVSLIFFILNVLVLIGCIVLFISKII